MCNAFYTPGEYKGAGVSGIEVIRDEEFVESLLVGVSLEGDLSAEHIGFAPELGFLAMQGTSGGQTYTYALGFYASSKDHTSRLPVEITPVTEFAEVSDELRHVGAQGKGVGPRLHNTLPMIDGIAEHGPVGLYSVQVGPEVVIHDARRSIDKTVVGKGMRVAEHAGKIIQARLVGPDKVVSRVHDKYGSADIAIIHNPPRSELRQRRRGVEPIPGVDPSIMIIRDKRLPLMRAGFVVS